MAEPKAGDERATLTVGPLEGDRQRFTLTGALDSSGVAPLWRRTLATVGGNGQPRHITVDASGVTWCDGSGVALLVELDRRTVAAGGSFQLEGFPAEFTPLLKMFMDHRSEPEPEIPPEGFVTEVGRHTVWILGDLRDLIIYTGAITATLAAAALRPHRIRWRDVFRVAEEAGVNATPVAMLIGFLIGVVMGFQSAMTLRQYGGEVFLGGLIGVSMVRILGPLLTAIVLTARSGSAFAAEIGTMTVNEEVDAMRVMAIDPVHFLVVPRILAAVVMLPLLSTFAVFAGLFGGGLVSVFILGLPLRVYTDDIARWVEPTDILGALAKTLVFGLVVAAAGCIRGLQTTGGAVGVGRSTTRAVVSGIVLLALTESLFSILYYHLGI